MLERIGEDVGQLKRYPVDFPLLEVGYNVAIKSSLEEDYEYFKITNRSRIPETIFTDENVLNLTTGQRRDLGNMEDWLETDERRALYCIAVGARADRDIDMRFHMPSSDSLYGTKNQPNITVKVFDTPEDRPEIWFWTKGDKWIPSVTVENNTGYQPVFFEMVARGYKYRLKKLDSKPSRFHEIVLPDVRGGL